MESYGHGIHEKFMVRVMARVVGSSNLMSIVVGSELHGIHEGNDLVFREGCSEGDTTAKKIDVLRQRDRFVTHSIVLQRPLVQRLRNHQHFHACRVQDRLYSACEITNISTQEFLHAATLG
jgi:hypothetical protein